MAKARRILVVDDHFRILDSIKSILETSSKEYEVIGVPSAEEGILEIRREPVELLITDIYLPGMSGGELIVRANKLWPDLPIIVITGHAEKMGREEAAKSGIVHYFKKPLDSDVFLEAVHSVLDRTDQKETGKPGGAPQDSAISKRQAVRSIMDDLRSDTGAREVLLASIDGKVIYETGGQESAFSVFSATFTDTVTGILRLTERMGSVDPLSYHYISDRQFELFFATAGSDYYIAVLYYAQSSNKTIESVWTFTKQALDKIMSVIYDAPQVEPTVATVENLESEQEDDSIGEFTPPIEEVNLAEHVSDETPMSSGAYLLDLPEIDESVDIDAFWEEALADELGDEESSEGLSIDEARRVGLIPPEFDPDKKPSG